MRAFELDQGGPFRSLMQRLRLVTPGGAVRGRLLAVLAWLPFACGERARITLGLRPDPAFLDISTHVRLLVTLPVVLIADRLTARACRSTIASLYNGRFCAPAELDAIVDQAERLRGAPWPEALLLALALLSGQLALWRVTGATGVFHGGVAARSWSFPRVGYVTAALPLVQFVMYRSLWRWLIWSSMLVRIARLRLALLATHPDEAAGLSCLTRPLSGFSVFAFATAAILAGAWGPQILAHRTTLRAQTTFLLVFVVVETIIATAPLLPFCRHLYQVRRQGLATYGDFATGYMWGFQRRWIASGIPVEDSLGSPHIQSMNDLGGVFRGVQATRLFPFGTRSLVALWTAALLPMLPLLGSAVTAEHLLKRIASVVLGGLPL